MRTGAVLPNGYTPTDLGQHPNPAKAAEGKRLHGLAPDPQTRRTAATSPGQSTVTDGRRRGGPVVAWSTIDAAGTAA